MNGHIFISNLKALNLPGVENLKPNDIDWVFLKNPETSSSLFWKWFFSNIQKDDILSDEELVQYEKLLSSGSVLSEKHLKQIENCLENVSADEDLPIISFMLDEGCSEDLVIYKNKLELLRRKRDLLSMQKMEAEFTLNNRRHCVDRLRHELESQTLQVLQFSNDYSRDLEDISKYIQTTVMPFQSFKSNVEEAKFVIQIPNDIWLEQERVFIEALFKYIHKQFHEGIKSFVGLEDDSQYCLLDSSQLNLQFIRGPKQAEYLKNVQDLNRINTLLEETELKTIECELEQACKTAEMNEAIKFQRTLFSQTSSYSSLSLIREQLTSLIETQKALEQDFQFQIESLKELGSLVSKIEGFRVVSGNYEIKLKRQEYFLSKQEIVSEFLLGHLSRLNLMKIMYDIDKQKIGTILDILISLNKFLVNQYEESVMRLNLLNHLKELYLKNGLVNEEKKTLQTLLCCQAEGADPQVMKNIVKNARQLNSSLSTSSNEIQSMSDAQMNVIEKLFKSCSVLEEILFGKNKLISNLPEVWINCNLLDHQAKVEQKMWQLQQEMFKTIKAYEKKKKILEDTPSIRNDLLKWTEQISCNQ